MPAARGCASRSSLPRLRTPRPHTGFKDPPGPPRGKGRLAPRGRPPSSSAAGPLTSLPHPHPRAAACGTRSRRLFPSPCDPLLFPSRPPSHFADRQTPPPLLSSCQGCSPFPVPTRVTSQATEKLVRTTPPHSNDKCPRRLHRPDPPTTTPHRKSSRPFLRTVLVTSVDQPFVPRPALLPFKSKLRKASWRGGWVMTPASHPPFPDPDEMPEEWAAGYGYL